MSWLIVLFAIEAGMVPNNAWWLYQEHEVFESDEPGYYTDFEIEAELWGWAFVGGSLRTDMTTDTFRNYSPHWFTYDFTAGARWEFLEVGWRHRCSHPIQTYVTHPSRLREPVIEGAYDEFYLRAQWELDI